jgi:excisionase family DNA binding protein
MGGSIYLRTLRGKEDGFMETDGSTIPEVAQRLGVSTRTVHRYLRNGLLEGYREGGKVYVSEDSLRKIDSLKAARVQGLVDPTKHVVIERDEWQAAVTRLAQLETEREYLLQYQQKAQRATDELSSARSELAHREEVQMHLEADLRRVERAMQEASEELRVNEADLEEVQGRMETLERELTRTRRPWWDRMLGGEKK